MNRMTGVPSKTWPGHDLWNSMSKKDVKLLGEESLFRTNAFRAKLAKSFCDLEI